MEVHNNGVDALQLLLQGSVFVNFLAKYSSQQALSQFQNCHFPYQHQLAVKEFVLPEAQ
jgi:hypothetical protein